MTAAETMTLLGSVHRNVLEDKLYDYMARPPSPADDDALLAAADAGQRTWDDNSEVRLSRGKRNVGRPKSSGALFCLTRDVYTHHCSCKSASAGGGFATRST